MKSFITRIKLFIFVKSSPIKNHCPHRCSHPPDCSLLAPHAHDPLFAMIQRYVKFKLLSTTFPHLVSVGMFKAHP